MKEGYEIINGRVLKTCKENQERNNKTKRCRKKVITCNNIMIKYDGYNSCYLDSLLVSLFTSESPHIYELFFNSIIVKNELYNIANEIRTELYKTFLIISGKEIIELKYKCKNLRKLMNTYKKAYNIYNPNNTIDQNDWQRVQSEPVQTLEFLNIIFNFNNTTSITLRNWGSNKLNKKIIKARPITERNENMSFIHKIDCNINGNIVNIKLHIPSNIYTTFFDNNNLWKVNNEKYKYKIEEFTINKSGLLLIHINRITYDYNIASHIKSSAFVKITKKLKLGDKSIKSLHSIIIHNGIETGGHYNCIYKCKEKWYIFDDLQKKIKCIGTFTELSKNINYMTNCTDLIYI